MPAAYDIPSVLSPAAITNTASLLRIVAFFFISGAAISSRLFAVINYESIIHELSVRAHFMLPRAVADFDDCSDPWFN